MQKIADGIYAEWEAACPDIRMEKKFALDRGANPCCIITGRGVVQIDTTKNPVSALEWQEEVRKVTDKEIVYVINTEAAWSPLWWVARSEAHGLAESA